MSNRRRPHRREERGQIVVLFALAALVIISMVGLVLDGGDTFAQRRSQQSAADLAAEAGANAYLNTSGNAAARTAAATAAARSAATRNGYEHGTGGVDVPVNVTLLSAGASVRVGITGPHPNTFARVVPGMESWDVSVTAAAISGTIDTAVGAAPWLMHIDAFNPDGSPIYGAGNPQEFGVSNGDYPEGPLDIAWTDFNGADNVNSAEVKRIIDGVNVVTATMVGGQYVGQHNNGYHNTLFNDIDASLAGTNVPIPVTGPCPGPNPPPSNEGCFKGWAMFHVISAQGGSDKTITGYFLPSGFVGKPLSIGECTAAQAAAGTCGEVPVSVFGQYLVRLSD